MMVPEDIQLAALSNTTRGRNKAHPWLRLYLNKVIYAPRGELNCILRGGGPSCHCVRANKIEMGEVVKISRPDKVKHSVFSRDPPYIPINAMGSHKYMPLSLLSFLD